ncbi:MAG: EAL domain-containing protein, partial [Prochlorothrix sp.]|nr:EAL domain-containing protein [Prochlorothrix sp.]
AILTLAHALDLKVVAEGIESAEEQHFLHGLGCDALQGYYIARPLSRAKATQWLAQVVSSGGA